MLLTNVNWGYWRTMGGLIIRIKQINTQIRYPSVGDIERRTMKTKQIITAYQNKAYIMRSQ